MSALQALINQKNQWNAIFNGEQFEIQTAKGRQRVASMIDSDLSPENLTCDGEMPRSQVQARYRALTAAAKELVKLDPSVKIYEFS
jgi:lipopolysaccharide biosynthesis protein